MAPKASNQEMDQEHQEICPHGPASWHIHYMNLDRMATIQMFKYRLYVLYKYIYIYICISELDVFLKNVWHTGTSIFNLRQMA